MDTFKQTSYDVREGIRAVHVHDANFNMNFEPSFLIVGLELVSTRSYTMSVQTTLTCISATVFKSRYDYQEVSPNV